MIPANIDDTVAAYITGLFDGEGCVFVDCVKIRKFYRITYKLLITNTDEDVLKWCRKFIGGHIIENARASRESKGHKRCFRLILEGKSVFDTLPYLMKFSHIKKKQLTNLYDFLMSRKIRPANIKYNEYEMAKIFAIKSEIQNTPGLIEIRDFSMSLDEFHHMIKDARTINSKYDIFDWTPETIALLGTATDIKIANQLGIKRVAVARKRQSLGITAFRKTINLLI
jgi:hypothetical protein